MATAAVTDLDPYRIQDEAERAAGFADPERDIYFPNLVTLIASANAEGQLNASGAERLHEEAVASIRKRLDSIRWIRDVPAIGEQPIEAPLILTGLPRSGTTYFQNLFDLDPALRLIRTWEGAEPCPPPALDPGSCARRLEAARAHVQDVEDTTPEFKALHLYDPAGPEECHPLLTQTFSAAGHHNMMNVPSYFDFLVGDLDRDAAYRNHHRQLQILQWRSPNRRWALKYPNHVIAMDSILRIYPDARFVVTHRDPRQTLASICKLTYNTRFVRTDINDKKVVGAQMRHFIRRHLDGLMAFHDSPMARRAIHVDYYRLAAAPADVFPEVYDALGLEITDDLRSAIAGWHRSNPQGKHGKNAYALEDYGLEADEIAEFYGDYIEAFDIPSEAEGLASVAP